MRISDWSSDVCSSDLTQCRQRRGRGSLDDNSIARTQSRGNFVASNEDRCVPRHYRRNDAQRFAVQFHPTRVVVDDQFGFQPQLGRMIKIADGAVQYLELRQCTWPTCFRSEEHTSELQSLMRISYAVLCLRKIQSPSQPNGTTKYHT